MEESVKFHFLFLPYHKNSVLSSDSTRAPSKGLFMEMISNNFAFSVANLAELFEVCTPTDNKAWKKNEINLIEKRCGNFRFTGFDSNTRVIDFLYFPATTEHE